jgi:putative ABC transport system permease protein
METLWQDLRYGARMLARNPGFTTVAVLTLALGIGANTAIFSVVNAVLLRPLPFDHPDRIVTLGEKTKDGNRMNVGYATYVDWQTESRTFEHLAAYRWWDPSLIGEGPPERLSGLRVSQPFFSILGVQPALGRDFLPDEDRPDNSRVVILSHGLWQRRFGGDPEVVGRPVMLSGRNYTVVGVLPASFQSVVSTFAYDSAEIWRPLGYDVSQPWACRTCRHLRAIGRLSSGVSLEQAQAEIETITSNLKQDFPDKYSGQGVRLIRLHDHMVGNVRLALLVLLGAVGFVLLIGCANVANLHLARAANREREIAIRAALGAGRRRLFRQLVTESLLLAVLGGAAGLLLALWGVDALLALSPADLPRLDDVRVDSWVLTFGFAASIVTGLMFGLAPGLQSSQPDLNKALKQGGRTGVAAGPSRLRSLLVVVETTLALVLLVGAALLVNSFFRLSRVHPGFDTKNMLTLTVTLSGEKYSFDEQVLTFHQRLADRIQALPGVESVAWASNLPLSGNHDRYGMPIEDRPEVAPPDRPSVERYVVSSSYLRTMRIPLLRGRVFTEKDDAHAPGVALINQTLAQRLWPGENPIGKRIRMGGGPDAWRTIVGIVGDVRHYGLALEPSMQAYVPHPQMLGQSSAHSWLIRARSDPANLAAAVRDAVWAVDPDQPAYGVLTLEQMAAASVAQERFTMVLLGIFATVALVLAAIGIYGVISYSVSQRTHEIGIRMALGAQPRDIFKLVVGQGMALTLAGVGVGLAGAFALTRFLESLLFGVSATDPVTFAGVALLLAAVALLACYIPARRAARVDPLVVLRYE